MKLLEKADVPAMPIYGSEGVLSDPHLRAAGFFREVVHSGEGHIRQMAVLAEWSRTPPRPDRMAPWLGNMGTKCWRRRGFPLWR